MHIKTLGLALFLALAPTIALADTTPPAKPPKVAPTDTSKTKPATPPKTTTPAKPAPDAPKVTPPTTNGVKNAHK